MRVKLRVRKSTVSGRWLVRGNDGIQPQVSNVPRQDSVALGSLYLSSEDLCLGDVGRRETQARDAVKDTSITVDDFSPCPSPLP